MENLQTNSNGRVMFLATGPLRYENIMQGEVFALPVSKAQLLLKRQEGRTENAVRLLTADEIKTWESERKKREKACLKAREEQVKKRSEQSGRGPGVEAIVQAAVAAALQAFQEAQVTGASAKPKSRKTKPVAEKPSESPVVVDDDEDLIPE